MCLYVYIIEPATFRLVAQTIKVLDRPRGFQEVKARRFQNNRHMKVVRLSALLTGIYHQGNIPGTHFY